MEEPLISVRRVNENDVEIFRSIRLEALRSEPVFFASTYEDWDALPMDGWLDRVSEPVFVAFQNKEPVGLIGLLQEKRTRSMHRASIVMVYVRQSLRGRGIAKKLLSAIEKHAGEIGVTQLELTVSAENPVAIGLYRKKGFVEAGRILGSYIHEGRAIDDVLMVRRLVA